MRLVVGDTRALARLRLLVSPPLLLPEDTPRAVRMGAIPTPPACHPSMPACGDTPGVVSTVAAAHADLIVQHRSPYQYYGPAPVPQTACSTYCYHFPHKAHFQGPNTVLPRQRH